MRIHPRDGQAGEVMISSSVASSADLDGDSYYQFSRNTRTQLPQLVSRILCC